MSSRPETSPNAGAAIDGGLLDDSVVADLMRDAQVGIWRFNPDTDTYFFSSELDLGYPGSVAEVPRELLGRIQHPADAPRDHEIRERLTREVGEDHHEIRYRHAAGHWVCLRVNYRTGRRLPSGRFEMYGISQNVTEQAQARDEATAQAAKARLALHAAHAGMFEYDYRTKTYSGTQEFSNLLGRRGMKRVTNLPETIFHPDDRERVTHYRRSAVAAGRSQPIDVRVMGPKGYFWGRLFFEVERDASGQPERGVGLVLDVDAMVRQRLALEEARHTAEAATAAKSTFLASVSHEIRTPLNGVSGILNRLKREPLSGEARDLVDQALGCSQMLGQLINDILDFSKIEAGKLDTEAAPTDIAAAVDGVVAMLRPGAEAKGIYLRVGGHETAGWAMIDALRLRQCLFNIAGNAIKFTGVGGVDIRLAMSGKGPAQRLRCEISDTGIGIPREAQGRLFNRFQQAETGTTRKFGGTGLGLAISRSLARLMGGDMGFTSRPGEGSTFWFEIAAPVCAAAAPETDLSDMSAPLEGLRVLVVDDNATNLLVASKTLEAMGAEADTADSGAVAIEAVQAKAFDLVLMDINMPGMDGVEATRLIRALPGEAAKVAIIALTADVMSHQRQGYLAAGMNGVAPKPFSPAQLLTEIVRLFAEADSAAA